VARSLPAVVKPPWEGTWGERVEVWKLDLLELDTPNINEWLARWEPSLSATARRLPLAPGPGARGLPLSEPGAYIARGWDGHHWRTVLLCVSPLAIALTLDDDDLEVYCLDGPSGKPVQGAFVKTIYKTTWRGRRQVVTDSGTTDASGRWHSAVVRDRFAPQVEATAVVALGNNYALATARRHIEPSPPVQIAVRALRHHVHPGQKAGVSGRLTRVVNGRAVPVGNAAVKLWLLGPDDVPIVTRVTRTTPVGHFTMVFALPRDARPGRYTVACAAEAGVRCWPRRFAAFEVAALAPEPFGLRARANTAVLAPGGELRVEVEATDAQGRPIPGVKIRSLSLGYPVRLAGKPQWLVGEEPVEPGRVVIEPIRLTATQTDARGKAALRWRATRADLPKRDLLCGIELLADSGSLGATSRRLEVLLLAEPPLVSIQPPERFARPGEAVDFLFDTPLAEADQEKVRARCQLTYYDRQLSARRFTLYDGAIAGLAGKKLRATLSQPGRYEVVLSAGRCVSRAVVWVVGAGADIPWGGGAAPAVVLEPPWARAGGSLLAVVLGKPRGSPLALTVRKRSGVERRLVDAPAGARCIELSLSPRERGPVELRLAQVGENASRVASSRLWVEPGGSHLDISSQLMWVRKRQWSERGYLITTAAPDGTPVQSVVELAFVRPTFVGSPPRGVRALRVVSHAGKATSRKGELEVGLNEELLKRACGMCIEALSPDGRRGSTLAFLHAPSPVLDLPAGRPRSPQEILGAIVDFGLDGPVPRWLAERLLERHPETARAIPRMVAVARSGREAATLLALASDRPGAAPAALEAALASGKLPRADAVAAVASHPADVRPVLERLLKTDSSAEVRAAAARALAPVAGSSLEALTEALREDRAPMVRGAAAEALASAGQHAAEALEEGIRNEKSAEVSLAIVHSLGRLRAFDGLLEALARKENAVVGEALRELARSGYSGVNSRLIGLLHSRDQQTASLAATVLVRAGPGGVEQVLRVARRRPREGLIRALAEVSSAEVGAAMRRWLRHEERSVRLAAAEWLARRGDELATGALREFLGDHATPQERNRAALALVNAGDVTSVPRLVTLARERRLGPATATALLRKAGQMGWREAGPLVVEALWRGVAHPADLAEPQVRALWLAAADAAPSVGPLWSAQTEAILGPIPPDCPYREPLERLERDGVAAFLEATWALPLPDDLRRHAVRAFARLEGKGAATRLIPLLDSPVLQRAALCALIEQGAVEALRVGLAQGSAVVRASSAAALGALADPAASPRLRQLLDDPDPFVRMEAAHALAAISRQAVFYKDHLGESRLAIPR